MALEAFFDRFGTELIAIVTLLLSGAGWALGIDLRSRSNRQRIIQLEKENESLRLLIKQQADEAEEDRNDLKESVAQFRQETRQDMSALRSDISGLRTELMEILRTSFGDR